MKDRLRITSGQQTDKIGGVDILGDETAAMN